ncbi:amidase [Sulfitobacter sp. LCG007]
MMDGVLPGGPGADPPADPFARFDLHLGKPRTGTGTPEGAAHVPDGIAALLQLYAEGETTPAEQIARIESLCRPAPASEAVLSILDTEAQIAESARRWADGTARALEGVPFGVKAIVDVAGGEITCGSLLAGSRIAARDAPAVARLRAAGAIPVAMLATTEFAAGSPFNPRHGVVTNPHDPRRWTGGSSTGSGAAVARRILPFALGTDTGGSIRVPACWCGVTGLKPTRGLVSTQGVAPLSWTLDHLGPLGLSASDIARVMQVMADVAPMPPRPLRIGVPDGWFTEMVDSAVLDAWSDALSEMERLGATCVPVSAADMFGDMSTNHEAGWTILTAELSASQRHNADRRSEQDAGLQARIARGDGLSAADYLLAMSHRTALIGHVLEKWNIDLLVTPGIGGEAGLLDGLRIEVDDETFGFDIISRNTMIWDLTGFPALMLPSGKGRNGLPVGIQIVGRPCEDALVLSLGAAFQSITDHHLARP